MWAVVTISIYRVHFLFIKPFGIFPIINYLFNRLTSACICNVLRKYILTLGPNFYIFSVFFTTDMFLFCKTILYSGNCRIFRNLAFGNIKTRFKAILKKLDFSAQIDFSAHIYFFHDWLPPEGDFSAHIYFC